MTVIVMPPVPAFFVSFVIVLQKGRVVNLKIKKVYTIGGVSGEWQRDSSIGAKKCIKEVDSKRIHMKWAVFLWKKMVAQRGEMTYNKNRKIE